MLATLRHPWFIDNDSFLYGFKTGLHWQDTVVLAESFINRSLTKSDNKRQVFVFLQI